ncbi:MAG: membrane protein insertion efficiency factor YidD [Victivallales bacterium]|nr:membrane protein insertion efficiency factor YidD [Victivallales bacterium]
MLSMVADWPARFCACLIRFYQMVVSPWKPRCCRFVPTCSEYAKQAYLTHGFWQGTLLTVWRLLRCQPFYHGDIYDPVPPPKRQGC